MSFDYTRDAQRVPVHLHTVITNGPYGRIEGLLPLVQRLRVVNPEPFQEFVRAYGTALISAAYRAAAPAVPALEGHPLDLAHASLATNDRAKARWRRRQPTDDEIAKVFAWLNTPDDRHNAANEIEGLRGRCLSDIRRMVLAAETATDMEELDYVQGARFGWRAREGQISAHADTREQDPFEQCRLEVLAAMTGRGPGIVSCDVCNKWFVPQRAGRPARRCPGFECPQLAEQMYQQSEHRREYRRMQMRLARAERRGDLDGAADIRRELETLGSEEEEQ